MVNRVAARIKEEVIDIVAGVALNISVAGVGPATDIVVGTAKTMVAAGIVEEVSRITAVASRSLVGKLAVKALMERHMLTNLRADFELVCFKGHYNLAAASYFVSTSQDPCDILVIRQAGPFEQDKARGYLLDPDLLAAGLLDFSIRVIVQEPSKAVR